MLKRLAAWVRVLLRRDVFEDDMAEEMRLHLEARTADLVRRGVPPELAGRRARLAFGSVEKHKDLARAAFGLRLIDEIRGDTRLALRRLASRPSLPLFIVAIIALGVGASTAVFSVVDQTVLRSAPFLDGNRLVDVFDVNHATGGAGNNLTPGKIVGWQSQPALFERFEAYAPHQFDLSDNGTPERVSGLEISTGLFDMLGVAPRTGRDFRTGDGRPGADRVAIISDSLWQRRFGGTPDVLGRIIALNDQEYTIIGVMGRRFRLLSDKDDVWLPFDVRAHVGDRQRFAFYGIGRLARGVQMSGAQGIADRLADRLQHETPLPGSWELMLQPKHVADVEGAARTSMLVLLGSVGFVLLITCANVTSLQLTQIPLRMRETALRIALGGSRGRMARAMLVETMLPAIAGGALGVLLSRPAVAALVSALPDGMISRVTTTIEVDTRVFWVAAAAIAIVSLAIGIVPALRASRANPDAMLKNAGTRVSTGRLPSALVIAEIAFSLVLLAGAALMTRTLVRLESIDPGFDPDGLVAMHVDLPSDRYGSAAARIGFFESVLAKVRALPGILDVAVATGVPPGGGGFTFGPLHPDGSETVMARGLVSNVVTPSFFSTLRIPIVSGRNFKDGDPPDAVIVSRGLATRLWPRGEAVGRRFQIGSGDDPSYTVIGVAQNVESRIGMDERTSLQMYSRWIATPLPGRAMPRGGRTYDWRMLIVRASDPMSLVSSIERQIWTIDPRQPVEKVARVSDLYGRTFARQRFVLVLMSAFSVVALILTAAGIFGLLAQMVAQRTREIGIRIALGATRAQLLRLIASRGLTLTLAGSAIGIAGALALAPVLRSLLFDITPTDPMSYATVFALLAAVALSACGLAARQATHVDPITALRVD